MSTPGNEVPPLMPYPVRINPLPCAVAIPRGQALDYCRSTADWPIFTHRSIALEDLLTGLFDRIIIRSCSDMIHGRMPRRRWRGRRIGGTGGF